MQNMGRQVSQQADAIQMIAPGFVGVHRISCEFTRYVSLGIEPHLRFCRSDAFPDMRRVDGGYHREETIGLFRIDRLFSPMSDTKKFTAQQAQGIIFLENGGSHVYFSFSPAKGIGVKDTKVAPQ